MDKIDLNYWLAILGLVFIGIEIAIGAASGFDLLLTGLIFLLSGVIGFAFGSTTISLIMVVVLVFVYVAVGRRTIRKSLMTETKNTNVDNLMGKTAVVTKKIAPHHAGQIKIEGEIWRAEADKELETGDKAKIVSVSGVTLKVD